MSPQNPSHSALGSAGEARTSVIIPCHNYGRFLSWAITSVLHQTVKAKEIIVINDSSTDDTTDVARSFGNLIQYHQVDFGCAQTTRNFGLQKAAGDFVLFLDADDFLDNHALELLELALDQHPDAKLAYCGRIHFGENVHTDSTNYPHVKIPNDFSLETLRRYNFISMPSLIRRDGFPGFDTNIKRFQDWDAWLSLLTSDHDAVCVHQPLIHVRVHGTNKTLTENYFTERFKILLKHNIISSFVPNNGGSACAPDNMTPPFNSIYMSRVNQGLPLSVGVNFIQHIQLPGSHPIHAAQSDQKPAPSADTKLDSVDQAATQANSLKLWHNADALIIDNTESTPDLSLNTHFINDESPQIYSDTPLRWQDGFQQPGRLILNRAALKICFQIPSHRTSTPPHKKGALTPIRKAWQKHIGWRFK